MKHTPSPTTRALLPLRSCSATAVVASVRWTVPISVSRLPVQTICPFFQVRPQCALVGRRSCSRAICMAAGHQEFRLLQRGPRTWSDVNPVAVAHSASARVGARRLGLRVDPTFVLGRIRWDGGRGVMRKGGWPSCRVAGSGVATTQAPPQQMMGPMHIDAYRMLDTLPLAPGGGARCVGLGAPQDAGERPAVVRLPSVHGRECSGGSGARGVCEMSSARCRPLPSPMWARTTSCSGRGSPHGGARTEPPGLLVSSGTGPLAIFEGGDACHHEAPSVKLGYVRGASSGQVL